MTKENFSNLLGLIIILILTSMAYFFNNLRIIILIPLLITLIYLIKNKQDKKILLSWGIYFIINIIYLFREDLPNLIPNILHFINLYLPLFFSLYFIRHNIKLNKNILTLIFIILSLFIIINPFSNLIISLFLITMPLFILTIIKTNNYLFKLILMVIFTYALFSLNSLIGYLCFIMTIIYFILTNFKSILNFFRTNYLKSLITILVFLLFLTSYLPNLALMSRVDFTSFTSVSTIFQNFLDTQALNKLLGLFSFQTNIDLLTIFFNLGIVGSLIYLSFIFYILKNAKLKNVYLLTFIFTILLSFFGFNILTNIFAFTLVSLIFIFNKQPEEKRDILLITNMYPSKKYPHYGVFVDHTYELLKENGYQIDLVKMTKSSNILDKLIKYISFYLASFFKALVNNYSYYYVHFISHSTIPIFIPYLTSYQTKLILNVHGNDIVADTKIDNKNIKRSRFFLKYADNVIAPSKYFQDVLTSEYQVNKSKITIYPAGGVDLTKFKKIPRKEALKLSGLNSKYKYLGFISRIEKDKGYDTLINAIYNIKTSTKLKNIKFLIVGSGSEVDILEKLIKKNKLSKLIIRKDFLSQEELVYVYNSLEALIYPTRRKSESLGLTGLEAMACETLVIGSNLYGPGSYLNKQNSLPFNPYEEKTLEEAILKFLNLKAKEKNELIKNAYNTVEEYSQEKTKSIILDVFKK